VVVAVEQLRVVALISEQLRVAVAAVGQLHVEAAVWVRPRVAGLVSEQPRALAAVSKQLHVAAPVWVQLRASAASSTCSPFAALSYVALWYAAWSPCGLCSHVLAVSLRRLCSCVHLSHRGLCVWRYVRAQSYVLEHWCGW
jgi:hypothetical protein